MALRKVGDEWTATGVKSTFIIDIPEDPSSQVSGALTYICGWGWRFAGTVGAVSSTESPRLIDTTTGSAIPWRRVTVFFHPDLIRSVPYGRVTFVTHTENLQPVDDALFYSEFDLPDNSRRPQINPSLGEYMRRSDATGPAMITIDVKFPATLGMVLPQALDRGIDALAATIRGDEVVDVKFYAYTRRGDSYVAHPRPMFAKMSLLLGHSNDLDTYLRGVSGAQGFAESLLVDLDAHTQLTKGVLRTTGTCLTAIWIRMMARRKKNVYPSILQSPRSLSPNPALTTPRRIGQAVVVKGHAFQTWNALLHYLYTNKIVFRNLKSSGGQGGSEPLHTLQCSPKSMYKLAEKFGLEDLKALALASLRSQLSSDNIVREAFSSFTSMYPEISDIEVGILINHMRNLGGDIDEMLKSICNGGRPQSFDVLRKIVRGTGSIANGTATLRALSLSGSPMPPDTLILNPI
ncbi:hypothetical protein C8R43DRAFT_1177098 [Mycena crocata]|nr:hypothetical protein C8R43DRAFT_1177098 [Mycena crocata]